MGGLCVEKVMHNNFKTVRNILDQTFATFWASSMVI